MHAPVLGSVPAVTAGTLEIVVGGAKVTVEAVKPLLRSLGHIVHVGHANTAAALKLIANGALAGALTTVGEALRQADALGLDRVLVLDLLQVGPLGDLIRAKRDRLDDPPAQLVADFAVAGLVKDQALLAAMSPRPWPLARQIEAAVISGELRPDDDIAAVASVGAEHQGALAPLHAYISGHATGDPKHFEQAFMASAHIEGIRDGVFVSWTLDEYIRLFPGSPRARRGASHPTDRRRRGLGNDRLGHDDPPPRPRHIHGHVCAARYRHGLAHRQQGLPPPRCRAHCLATPAQHHRARPTSTPADSCQVE
jgi:hypothetical protein